MNILESLAVLGLLIVIHEAGHFLAARCQGIHVNGFSIGFGPALFKKTNNGVTYAIRAIPLGGFVSFPDEDEESDIPKNDPNLLRNRPIWQRAIVISAGVIANLLLAWIVLIGQNTFIGLPGEPEPGVLLVTIQPGQAAESAGLIPGDRIITINGNNLGSGQEAVQNLVKTIKGSPNKKLELDLIREGNRNSLTLSPTNQKGIGKVGAQLQPNVTGEMRPPSDFFEVLNQADLQFTDLLSKTIEGYKGLFTDFATTSQQLSGPVKIIEIGAQLSEQGSSGVILFAALISINLAVLNSLPLPLLDGGQMVLLLIEVIRGRPVPERLQIAFIQSGFVLLVGLSIVLIVKDTSQLPIVRQLIGR